MNERIEELAKKAGFKHPDHVGLCEQYAYFDHIKFAELIVGECINTLEFHGFDDAIPYVKWMATNKLGQHFGV
jgi:hypothetical protein